MHITTNSQEWFDEEIHEHIALRDVSQIQKVEERM